MSKAKYNCNKSCSIIGTSGHFFSECTSVSLSSNIRIIKEEEIINKSESTSIGSGRFSTCYSATYIHFKVCVKVPKNRKSLCHFIHEANIISQFAHENLPYLFGVSLKDHSIVMTYHDFKNQTITVHDVLHPKSATATLVQELASEWVGIVRQILKGCNCLHSKYKIIHNDLKCDNIVLTCPSPCEGVRAIIIDFNKACDIGKGKKYNLSNAEKEQYKKYHCHIAPDLRDGHCYQSQEADIFSLGKIIHTLCINSILNHNALLEISNRCMSYSKCNRPTMKQILDIAS